MTRQRNEGEGNRTAARVFNDAQRKFAKSGQVDEAARAAAAAVTGPDSEALREAEEKARPKRGTVTPKAGAARKVDASR